jgi:ornithine decarboxylase
VAVNAEDGWQGDPRVRDLVSERTWNWLRMCQSSLPGDRAVLLVDPVAAADNVRVFRRCLPRVDIYYAYKCFADEEIANAVDDCIAGYDVASLGEIEALRAIGVSPERMIFSNPVKVPRHIERAAQAGLRVFAAQSRDEVDKLAANAPGVQVSVRVRVPDQGTGQSLSRKFGIAAGGAVDILQYAADRGLGTEGFAFHVGSQARDPQLWVEAVRIMSELLSQGHDAGLPLTTVNIGGGFPAPYESGGYGEFERIACEVNAALDKYLPANIRIVAEPGRFIASSAACILTNVIGREVRGGANWLFLDSGVFQALFERFEFTEILQRVLPLTGFTETESIYTLAGPTCDSADVLGSHFALPSSLTRGDRLCITEAGAYTVSCASNFNGIEPPTRLYIPSDAGGHA